MPQYLIGLDNGGTYTKAVIFDTLGNQIAEAHSQIELIFPHDGWVERDMEQIWQANCTVLKNVMQKAAIAPSDLLGMSLSGHGKGLYLWGDDGAVYNGILSTDTRANEYTERWAEDGTAEAVYPKTFQKILACQPVSLLRWFQEKEPQVLKKAKWIFGIKDYIRFRLTGNANGEITDFSGSNLVNLSTKQYDYDILKIFGIEEVWNKLPPLKNSCDICGQVTQEAAKNTGLPIGIPVTAGMFDIDASAIAMNITNQDYLCTIAGTWGIHEYLSKQPVAGGGTILNSIFCLPNYYLVEDSSPTSASNNEWFVKTFMGEERQRALQSGENIYQKVDAMVEATSADEHDIYFFPYLYGSNYNINAKAAFIGLSPNSTIEKISRAVFEGIAMCHLVHINKLLATRSRPKAIRLSGGVVNSKVWVQIFADVFNMPIEIIQGKELGALGCAMTVGVAVGAYSSLEEAADKLVRVSGKVFPKKENVVLYRKKFKRYQKAASLLEELYT